MKKGILVAAVLGLGLTACKKEGDKVVLHTDSTNAMKAENSLLPDESETYTYKATDGSRANVSYQNEGNKHTITIKANNQKFVLDRKTESADSKMYERNGVQADVTKDSLHITQGDRVIPLVLSQ